MIGENAYLEAMRSCQKWNNKNVTTRISSNSGVFDQQTGIEQKPTDNLHRSRLERCTPTNALQVCSYPAKRYKHSKEFSFEACEFNYLRSTYPEINAAITQITNPPMEFIPEAIEQSSMPLRSNLNGPKTNGYEEFDESLDFLDDFEDDNDGDEWGSRRKKTKKNGRSERSARRSAVAAAATSSSSSAAIIAPPPIVQKELPMPPTTTPASSSSSEPRPFICTQCGAKYKSRPGLSYHRLHVHKDESVANEMQKILANAAQSPSLDISTSCDLCHGGKDMNNKTNMPEALVNCFDCGRAAHPSCVGFTPNMVIMTKKYGWQCIECKSCTICGTSENDEALLFCDDCDRGFHLYCLQPALKQPPEGNWSCQLCVKEFSQAQAFPHHQQLHYK